MQDGCGAAHCWVWAPTGKDVLPREWGRREHPPALWTPPYSPSKTCRGSSPTSEEVQAFSPLKASSQGWEAAVPPFPGKGCSTVGRDAELTQLLCEAAGTHPAPHRPTAPPCTAPGLGKTGLMWGCSLTPRTRAGRQQEQPVNTYVSQSIGVPCTLGSCEAVCLASHPGWLHAWWQAAPARVEDAWPILTLSLAPLPLLHDCHGAGSPRPPSSAEDPAGGNQQAHAAERRFSSLIFLFHFSIYNTPSR